MARKATGIYAIHSRGCASKADKSADCTCRPTWQGHVPGRFAGDAPLRRNFGTRGEAVAWRAEAMVAVGKGELKAPTKITLREAADELIAGMRDGSILNRSHAPYKPSAIRSYERALRLRDPAARFGPAKLSAITRPDLQRFVDDLIAAGLTGSTIRNTLDPLRAVVFRRAARYGEIGADPCAGLDVPPANRGGRDRIPPSALVPALVEALPAGDSEGIRALFAIAYRHGVRRGELRALRVGDLDLDAGAHGLLHITRAWDDDEGEVPTKTQAGERPCPLIAEARRALVAHLLASGRRDKPDALVFGRTDADPFVPSTVPVGAASRRRRRSRPAGARRRGRAAALHPARGPPRRGRGHARRPHRRRDAHGDRRALVGRLARAVCPSRPGRAPGRPPPGRPPRPGHRRRRPRGSSCGSPG